MDTRFKIDKLLARLNTVDLNNEWVDIREIDLDGSDSHVFFGQTEAPADTVASEPVNWRVRAASVSLAHTDFAFRDANQPRIEKGFDYGTIVITGFAGDLTDLYYSPVIITVPLAAHSDDPRLGEGF